MTKTQTALAIYLYGFTQIPPTSTLTKEGKGELPEILGVDDEHLISTHQCAGLKAVISSVALADYTGEAGESNLQNVAWLTPRACRHALVIDKLMEQGPVYPLSFGTLFSNISALEQEMKSRGHAVLAVLQHVSGCQEWSLEATLDRKKAVDSLLAEGLQCGRFSLPEGAGRRHLEEQKLRRHLTSELNEWLTHCLTSIQNELHPLSHDFCPRRITDDKVLYDAYLIRIEKVSAFKQQVNTLSQHFEAYGFNFRVTGPWAPYSFSQRAKS